MITEKFDALFNEYKGATDIMGRRIKVKLKEIVNCYDECSLEEREFSNEIINKFCELLDLFEERNENERRSLEYKLYFNEEDQKRNTWLPFSNGDALRIAFYNYFRNEQKNKKEHERAQYPEIQKLDDLKGSNVNPTMRDYVARIQTFTKVYLWDMPRVKEILYQESTVDLVLFTYKHLELILASFDTKEYNLNGEKVINKQKNNIRSALRKLNQFKQESNSRI